MLKRQAMAMLNGQIIPFWKSLRDDTYGGYYGYVGFDLGVDPGAVKGCILNSRILWFFSRCAKDLGREDCLDAASHAFRFLRDRFLDREYGGVFWSLDHKGEPRDETKHTYNQAFAVYALSAYYEASGDELALAMARDVFRLIESRCRDEGGYLEAFDRRFRPVDNEKLSENGVMAGRTMNTLLHVFEGYAGLYEAAPDPETASAMRGILKIFEEKIYDPVRRRQRVFFDMDYNSLIDLTSYGHDVESSWLLDWGCGLLGDRELTARISAIDSELARSVFENGYRGASVVNERENGAVDDTRVWWVQAEAVLGFLNMWRKHPEERKYLDAAVDVFGFINSAVVDRRPGGEWFWAVDENGRPDPSRPVADPWKCPYHNGRMCLELIRRDHDA